MEDRSALFNQLKNFSQRKLKKVETKVVTGTGEQLVEKRGAKGLQVLSESGAGGAGDQSNQEPERKLDLQVGLVVPGLLIATQDVAHDKSSLDTYGVTHILNLDAGVANKFEDDYNYKNVAIHDEPSYVIDKIFDDCFDFIDDGRHYGNVLVHCSGTVGLSRSTTICIAYLMDKEKQTLNDAFNSVKEARSFVRPNEGFMKQLKEFEVKLRGAQQAKESGIDDPFALRKKQEIEQEKAMVAGAASVKNRMKMFGATLDTSSAAQQTNRSKSVSPAPVPSSQQKEQPKVTTSKWSERNSQTPSSKSMTPEPRKSWRDNNTTSSNGRQLTTTGAPPPPPPPPPPLGNKETSASTNFSSSSSNKSSLPPPPPPPPPPAGSLLDKKPPLSSALNTNKSTTATSTSSSDRKPSVSSVSSDDGTQDKQKKVFGRRPPPPMKIRGGLSIERQDSTSDKSPASIVNTTPKPKSSLQLPLKKQFTSDSDGEQKDNSRSPSPSAALRAAKQQAARGQDDETESAVKSTRGEHNKQGGGQLNRSSTKKLLNLIKTKTRTDLTLPDGDENDEIEALLGALESESIDNIDWDELGLDEDEVKDIIKYGDQSSSSSSSDDDDGEEEEEEEEEEVETSTTHYIIRTK